MYIPKDLSNVLTATILWRLHIDNELVTVTGGLRFRFPDVLILVAQDECKHLYIHLVDTNQNLKKYRVIYLI